MSKFYDENNDECCLGAAVGRVPLRIIGGVCIGLGAIQIGLSAYVYDCFKNVVYYGFRQGGWWSGTATVVSGVFAVWAPNRGVVIVTNIASLIAILAGAFAIFCDLPGITVLVRANATYGYCTQSQAAAFIFDIIATIMAIALFITTCISLIFPSCFGEINIEQLKRRHNYGNNNNNNNNNNGGDSEMGELSRRSQDSSYRPNRNPLENRDSPNRSYAGSRISDMNMS